MASLTTNQQSTNQQNSNGPYRGIDGGFHSELLLIPQERSLLDPLHPDYKPTPEDIARQRRNDQLYHGD